MSISKSRIENYSTGTARASDGKNTYYLTQGSYDIHGKHLVAIKGNGSNLKINVIHEVIQPVEEVKTESEKKVIKKEVTK